MSKQSINKHSFCEIPPQSRQILLGIRDPGKHDVLIGQGAFTYNHTGNIKFRLLVGNYYRCHLYAKMGQKKYVAESIVMSIRSTGGRFLVKNKLCQLWFEADDKQALLKAQNALGKYDAGNKRMSNKITDGETRVQRDSVYKSNVQMCQKEDHLVQYALRKKGSNETSNRILKEETIRQCDSIDRSNEQIGQQEDHLVQYARREKNVAGSIETSNKILKEENRVKNDPIDKLNVQICQQEDHLVQYVRRGEYNAGRIKISNEIIKRETTEQCESIDKSNVQICQQEGYLLKDIFHDVDILLQS